MKETLKAMKKMLIEQTYSEVANLQCANYEELGAAIDMIKDLEEALYYCAVVEAMEKPGEDHAYETSQKLEHTNNTTQHNNTNPIIPVATK